MNAPFEVRGEWWLPSSPETKIAGTLKYSPDEGAQLALIGRLRSLLEEGERSESNGEVTVSFTEQSMERSGVYPRLHGVAGSTAFTLDDCLRTHATAPLMGGMGEETIYVNRVFKNVFFEESEELLADGVSVGLENLEDWVLETGIAEHWYWREDDQPLGDAPRVQLEVRELPVRESTIPHGMRLMLKHKIGATGDRLSERTVTQEFWWRVDTADPIPIEEMLDVASDLQDLVSIGTGRKAALRFLSYWHPDVARKYPDGQRVREPIEMFARWNVQAEADQRRLQPRDLLFSLGQMGGIDAVARWMVLAARFRGPLGRVMATRYASAMFVSDRVLNYAAALEGFDRDRTGLLNSRFKTRLRRCCDLADPPFQELVGDVETWAEAVRRERDDIAHHFGRRARSEGSEPFFIAESLYWLFVICMLRELDAPDEVFGRLGSHERIRWLRPRIRAVIA